MPATRRRRPKGQKPPAATYWWFQGASVEALIAQLKPDARLEVRIDAEQHMTLTVVPEGSGDASAAAAFGPPINDSRICPPVCP